MPAFYNRATLTYGGTTIDSNTVQGELTDALTIGKAAVQNYYRPGDAIAYAVTVANSGAADVENLRLAEDLGTYAFGENTNLVPLEYIPGSARYYVNGQLQDAPQEDAGAALAFRGIRVPAGGNAAILYSARVNEFAPQGAGASVVNASLLEGGGGSGAGLPLTASAEIFPEAGARLSISKSLSPAAVSAGEPLTYTLRIENSGSAPVRPEEGAVVSDRFDPLLDITSVRYNGAEWSAPANYSYDRTTGLFATVPGQLEVGEATFTQDARSGRWQANPGVSTIEITGTLR